MLQHPITKFTDTTNVNLVERISKHRHTPYKRLLFYLLTHSAVHFSVPVQTKCAFLKSSDHSAINTFIRKTVQVVNYSVAKHKFSDIR